MFKKICIGALVALMLAACGKTGDGQSQQSAGSGMAAENSAPKPTPEELAAAKLAADAQPVIEQFAGLWATPTSDRYYLQASKRPGSINLVYRYSDFKKAAAIRALGGMAFGPIPEWTAKEMRVMQVDRDSMSLTMIPADQPDTSTDIHTIRALVTNEGGAGRFTLVHILPNGEQVHLSTFVRALMPADEKEIVDTFKLAEDERQKSAERAAAAEKRQSMPTVVDKPARATGPSFDCTKAGTATEQAICSSAELASLDAAIAARINERGDRELLRDPQREWLKTVRNPCAGDSECLGRVMGERLAELKRWP